MLKLFRRYLVWVQNSVFEGELTDSQFMELQLEAKKLMQQEDGVIFYRLQEERYAERTVLGIEKGETQPLSLKVVSLPESLFSFSAV